MNKDLLKLIAEIESLGLSVEEKHGHASTGYVVKTAAGIRVGAFGANATKGRTLANLRSQIKRATGMTIRAQSSGHGR